MPPKQKKSRKKPADETPTTTELEELSMDILEGEMDPDSDEGFTDVASLLPVRENRGTGSRSTRARTTAVGSGTQSNTQVPEGADVLAGHQEVSGSGQKAMKEEKLVEKISPRKLSTVNRGVALQGGRQSSRLRSRVTADTEPERQNKTVQFAADIRLEDGTSAEGNSTSNTSGAGPSSSEIEVETLGQFATSDIKPQDSKGKRRRAPSPEDPVGRRQSPFQKDRQGGRPGDEEEAENLRRAVDASLNDARKNGHEVSGETSAAGATYIAEQKTPSPGGLLSSSPSSSAAPVGVASTASQPSPSTPRRTFAMLRQDATGSSPRPVTSQRSVHAPNEYRVVALPERDEVMNPQLQDPFLIEYYTNLPNLTLGVFVPWSSLRGSGQARFSEWADIAPDMDLDNALYFINFRSSGRFINPSRESPMVTRAMRVTSNGLRMHLFNGDQPAILVSTMLVRQSHILSLPVRGLRQHSIAGVGHSQEWERQVSFICMAFGQPELRAQLAGDVLTYSTRTDTAQAYINSPGQGTAAISPSIRMPPQTATDTTTESMALDYNDRIPVYDARNVPFHDNLWGNLDSLPRFEGEVPFRSFVAVGYTAVAYYSNRDRAWRVSCNVRFVVVVGTPAEDGEGVVPD